MRQLPFSSEPILYSYLQIVGSLLCFMLNIASDALAPYRLTARAWSPSTLQQYARVSLSAP